MGSLTTVKTSSATQTNETIQTDDTSPIQVKAPWQFRNDSDSSTTETNPATPATAATTMNTKKLVSQQQLYGVGSSGVGGSKKCLKQTAGIVTNTCQQHSAIPSQQQQQQHSNRCLLQSRQLSQSNIEQYGSYGSLPYRACKRHQGGGGVSADSNHWYPQSTHEEDLLCTNQIQQQQQQQQQHQQQMPACICADRQFHHCQQRQQMYTRPPMSVGTRHCPHHGFIDHDPKPVENGYYFGYDHGVTHATDEEDSAFHGINDFQLLHRNIPALRRTGIDTTGIRRYFYPDGGWGWIICGVAFLVHILTTGLQLSYILLLFYALPHLNVSHGVIDWIGALSWSISSLVTPFVIAFCRKKSTRLLAIVGGLIMPLGILFTSFATELSQVVFSFGFVFGIGASMVRESSTIMLGNYFRRRRQFVEFVTLLGEGVGLTLFSVILKDGVGQVGWRYGLQIIAAVVSMSFFLAFLYRPASLYHPQRRAIQHLKNQRKKMRENKFNLNSSGTVTKKYFFLDISTLKSATVRLFIMISAVAAFGIYTPIFTMFLNIVKEGRDVQDLVLLQTFLGTAISLGVLLAGALIRKPIKIRTLVVNKLVVSHIFLGTIALSILTLSSTIGYTGLCIVSWVYGIGFGGLRYAFKMLALEQIKVKNFSKAWGFIKGIECIPVLGSVPLTIFLNDYSLDYGRAGYYICSAATAIAGIITFFLKISCSNKDGNSFVASRKFGNGAVRTVRSMSSHHIRPNYAAEYLYNGCDYPMANLLNRSCISLNQVEDEHSYRQMYGCQRFRSPYLPAQYQHYDVEHDAAKNHQYHMGEGSIGARSGRRLQKSLSFIQHNPYGFHAPYTFCNCQNDYYHWSQREMRSNNMLEEPLQCTCTRHSVHFENSRSRSVPEGLSTISQQCTCKGGMQSKEIIYVPRTPLRDYDASTCPHHNVSMQRGILKTSALAAPRYQTKPIHFIEQITTSV